MLKVTHVDRVPARPTSRYEGSPTNSIYRAIAAVGRACRKNVLLKKFVSIQGESCIAAVTTERDSAKKT